MKPYSSQFQRKKAAGPSKKRQKVKKLSLKNKIRKKLLHYPVYVKFEQAVDKVAGLILGALLAFFDTFGPIRSFFFVKTQDPHEKSEMVIKVLFRLYPCWYQNKTFFKLRMCFNFQIFRYYDSISLFCPLKTGLKGVVVVF